MKVLLTGSRGYIGRILTTYLQGKGIEVIGLDNQFFTGAEFMPGFTDMTKITKDIRDVSENDLTGIDVVAHLAGLSNDPLGFLNPQLTYSINHKATVRLAKLAKNAGIKRFIFSSSCSMYGKAEEEYVTEDSSFNPQTPYAESKVLAEQDLVKLADEKFSPVYLRNSTVFGLSPRMRLDLVVNNLVASAMIDGVIKITSDGTPWRPLVHVEDVCQAFYLALIADRDVVHNQPFNVGRNDNNIQVKQIAEIVSKVIPNTTLQILGMGEPDTRSYKVSFAKIEEKLGYKAKYTVEDGVRQVYEYFNEIGFSNNHLSNPLYTTLDRVKNLIETNKVNSELYWKE